MVMTPRRQLTQEEMRNRQSAAQDPDYPLPPAPKGMTTEEFLKRPGAKEAIIESGIKLQAGANVQTQNVAERQAELTQRAMDVPLLDSKEFPSFDREAIRGAREYAPPAFGAGKQFISDIGKVGRFTLGALENTGRFSAIPKGTTEKVFHDPFAQIIPAKGQKQPSWYGPESEYVYGGSTPSEKGGAEILKMAEQYMPGGAMRRTVAAAPRMVQGPVRFMLEAANAAGQAQLHGQSPEEAAAWASLPGAAARGMAWATKRFAPALSGAIEKKGRSIYGGVFNPKTLREKSIAGQAVDPLIESQPTFKAGGPKLPKGIYVTRGQMARHAQGKADAATIARDAEVQRLGGPFFPMSYDDFERELDDAVNTQLKTTNPATGASEFLSGDAESAAIHIEGLKRKARNLSQPAAGGARTVPYQNLMDLKNEADDALALGGAFAEKRGGALNPELRGQRIFAGQAREGTKREAPEIHRLNKSISKWVNVVQGAEFGDIREFGRMSSGANPVVAAGGGADFATRLATFGKYRIALNLLEHIKGSPLARTTVGKGIFMNISKAIDRGDFDGAAAIIGRTAAQWMPEKTLHKPLPSKEEHQQQYKVTEKYQWTPGGLIPAGGTRRKSMVR